MTLAELVHQCQRLGICLAVIGDRLQIKAAKGIVTADLLKGFQYHKMMLITLLSTKVGLNLSEDSLEAIEERAALIEYEGELERITAVQLAVMDREASTT